MNPGNGKVHRDCAARCISGGVPAALVNSDKRNPGAVYYLQSATGGQLSENILGRAGEVTTLSGEGLMVGDQQFLILRSPPFLFFALSVMSQLKVTSCK